MAAKELSLDKIYGSADRVKSRNQAKIYHTHHEDGDGIITQYDVMPGVWLYFQDFHTAQIDFSNMEMKFSPDLISIQHCRTGRFEAEYANGEFVYLGEGDLSINIPETSPVRNSFPLSHYHGINIVIAEQTAAETVSSMEQVLGPMNICFGGIREQIRKGNRLSVYRSNPTIDHILSELYQVQKNVSESYLRLKCLELFMYLSTAEGKTSAEKPYFYHNQVLTIKEIRNYLVEHLDEHRTLEELSRQFQIPLTSMKKCFRGVYGMPVYAYLREFRIHKAAGLLRTTTLTTAEIAAKVGYESPSKFAEMFRRYRNMTPSEYRKNFCLSGAENDFRE